MEGTAVDIFATKGIEYLIVIGFLAALVLYWKLLGRVEPEPVPARPSRRAGMWFAAPRHYLFHPGHAWAAREGEGVYRVGMDDFAQQLVGDPSAVDLPGMGERVEQGGLGWKVRVGPRSIRMLSPVDGIVQETNAEVMRDPGIVNRDPYEKGWLMKVKVNDDEKPARNLITGNLVGDWLNRAAENLRSVWTREVGLALPDGGAPVHGFGRALSEDRWDEVAEDLLRSSHLPD